jgi:dihydroneopterin aldolase
LDIVFLHGLAIDCVVGLWDWERATTQRIYVDLDMGQDLAKPAKSQKLEDTLDYKSISKRVQTIVKDGKFKLVETMAEHIAKALIEEFSVAWCRVRVNKRGAVRGATDVGVIIERGTK